MQLHRRPFSEAFQKLASWYAVDELSLCVSRFDRRCGFSMKHGDAWRRLLNSKSLDLGTSHSIASI